MRTEFRPGRRWGEWRPTEAILRDLLDLLVAKWGNDDDVSVDMDLERSERTDTAEDIDEVRELITPDALEMALSLFLRAHRSHEEVSLLMFSWWGRSAQLTVVGSDQFAAEALRDRAALALEPGTIDASEDTDDSREPQPPATEQSNLPLTEVRFAGTYDDVHRLILDLARQTQEAGGGGRLTWTNIALTEVDRTITVKELAHLDQITRRDVRRLQRLTASFSTPDGPSSRLSISRRRLEGTVSGDHDAAVRALRSATNDLLRERGRSPHWLHGWMLYAVAFLLYVPALVLVNVNPHLWPASLALLGAIGLAISHPLYLPQVELLSEGEPTRWSRWSRHIVGLAAAWLLGCLPIPLFPN